MSVLKRHLNRLHEHWTLAVENPSVAQIHGIAITLRVMHEDKHELQRETSVHEATCPMLVTPTIRDSKQILRKYGGFALPYSTLSIPGPRGSASAPPVISFLADGNICPSQSEASQINEDRRRLVAVQNWPDYFNRPIIAIHRAPATADVTRIQAIKRANNRFGSAHPAELKDELDHSLYNYSKKWSAHGVPALFLLIMQIATEILCDHSDSQLISLEMNHSRTDLTPPSLRLKSRQPDFSMAIEGSIDEISGGIGRPPLPF